VTSGSQQAVEQPELCFGCEPWYEPLGDSLQSHSVQSSDPMVTESTQYFPAPALVTIRVQTALRTWGEGCCRREAAVAGGA
jgi:hypothetical protein